MKKLFAGILAAICCCAFVAPALAEVKVEGMIQSDFYYLNTSAERVAGGVRTNATTNIDDWNTTRINMPQPLNRITVRYTGEDKVVNGYIQVRAGGSRANPSIFLPGNYGIASESMFSWEYAWIDWHINPNFYLRFGRQDQTFGGAYAPAQGMAWNDGHIIGLNFGNITAQSRDAIRAFIKFNDNVRMEVQLLDPNTEVVGAAGAATGGTELALFNINGAQARESNVWPRFDISLPMQFGNFKIEPGFTYLKQEWDQVFAGSDDSYDVWGLTLGGSAGFGPFSIMGEVTYGKNLGPNSSHWGASNGQAVAYLPTGAAGNIRKIEDGETFAWWIQLGFDFGPFAIQGVVGMCKGSNDGDPGLALAADANEWDRTQWMYGLNFPIKVTKTFTVTPQIWYYDFGGSEDVGGNANTTVDFGSDLTIGVTFQLVF